MAIAEAYERNFCSFSDPEVGEQFGDVDLLIFCVDNLPANAHGNQAALLLGKPAVEWAISRRKGRRGRILDAEPCILLPLSLLAPLCRLGKGEVGPAASDGADVLAEQLLDSITGMIALGLLTQGADNRYGRLVDQLGDRQFFQIKIDPGWNWNGRDIVHEVLQIPVGNDAYFSFCTIARRDPDSGGLCPDCQKYRLGPRNR